MPSGNLPLLNTVYQISTSGNLKFFFFYQQNTSHRPSVACPYLSGLWVEINFPIFIFLIKNYVFIWLHQVLFASRGVFRCGSQTRVTASGLSSCSVWVQLPQGTWGLSSLARNQTHVPCSARWILNHWTTREIPIFAFLNVWKVIKRRPFCDMWILYKIRVSVFLNKVRNTAMLTPL